MATSKESELGAGGGGTEQDIDKTGIDIDKVTRRVRRGSWTEGEDSEARRRPVLPRENIYENLSLSWADCPPSKDSVLKPHTPFRATLCHLVLSFLPWE